MASLLYWGSRVRISASRGWGRDLRAMVGLPYPPSARMRAMVSTSAPVRRRISALL
jgi:hypothetical protein